MIAHNISKEKWRKKDESGGGTCKERDLSEDSIIFQGNEWTFDILSL